MEADFATNAAITTSLVGWHDSAQKWRVSLPGQVETPSQFTLGADGRLYLYYSDNLIHVYDRNNGALLSSFAVPTSFSPNYVSDSSLLAYESGLVLVDDSTATWLSYSGVPIATISLSSVSHSLSGLVWSFASPMSVSFSGNLFLIDSGAVSADGTSATYVLASVSPNGIQWSTTQTIAECTQWFNSAFSTPSAHALPDGGVVVSWDSDSIVCAKSLSAYNADGSLRWEIAGAADPGNDDGGTTATYVDASGRIVQMVENFVAPSDPCASGRVGIADYAAGLVLDDTNGTLVTTFSAGTGTNGCPLPTWFPDLALAPGRIYMASQTTGYNGNGPGSLWTVDEAGLQGDYPALLIRDGATSSASGALAVAVTPTTPLWKLDLTPNLSAFTLPAVCTVPLTVSITIIDDEASPQKHTGSEKICDAGTAPTLKKPLEWPMFLNIKTGGEKYLLQPDRDYAATITIAALNESASAAIHTPTAPVWVALGDSYSSGHHQDLDAPDCIDLDTSDVVGAGCGTIPNDLSGSWPYLATAGPDNINQLRSVPQVWRITMTLFASSGSTSIDAVNSQLPGALSLLQAHRGSWNVLSDTDGADDVDFATELLKWYITHTVPDHDVSPWTISGKLNFATAQLECPSSSAVDGRIVTDGPAIGNNLRLLVTSAQSVAPGTRIIDMLYPYVLPTSSPCAVNYSNHLLGKWIGATETIKDLDAVHLAVLLPGVIHVDPRSAAGFGNSPLNFLQLTRYYGYPHPSPDQGQPRLAELAISKLK